MKKSRQHETNRPALLLGAEAAETIAVVTRATGSLPCRLWTVRDTDSALAVLTQFPPLAVLLDADCRELNVLLVVAQLSRQELAPPVILFAGNPGLHGTRDLLGIDFYLAKPVSERLLTITLEKLLCEPRATRQKRAAAHRNEA